MPILTLSWSGERTPVLSSGDRHINRGEKYESMSEMKYICSSCSTRNHPTSIHIV